MICLNADVVILWTRSVLTIHLKEDIDTMTDTTEQFVLMKCEKCGYTENVPIHDILILRQLSTPDDIEDHLLCPVNVNIKFTNSTNITVTSLTNVYTPSSDESLSSLVRSFVR